MRIHEACVCCWNPKGVVKNDKFGVPNLFRIWADEAFFVERMRIYGQNTILASILLYKKHELIGA